MRSKTIGALAMIVGLAFTTGACSSQESGLQADYPWYESAQELIEASDLIVVGRAVSSSESVLEAEISTSDDPQLNPQAGLAESEDVQPAGVDVTVTSVQVEEVLNGSTEVGSLIDVVLHGIELTRGSGVSSDLTKIGDVRLVLSLAESSGTYYPVNPNQGIQALSSDGEGIMPVVPDTEPLKISGENAALTLSSLRQVAAQSK